MAGIAVLIGLVLTTPQRSAEAAAGCNNNGNCSGSETCVSCPNDCCPTCNNNGTCQATENACLCDADCGADPDDNCCTDGETPATETDCPTVCGDSLCSAPSENKCNCATDCTTTILGDGCCSGSENASNAPSDCPGLCGDGFCTHAESPFSCVDCGQSCGDGYCSGTEDSDNCATDCESTVTNLSQCTRDLPDCTDTRKHCCKRTVSAIGTEKAIIIPMDRCHQRLTVSGIMSPPAIDSPGWCAHASADSDEGLTKTYGLLYRLMQHNVAQPLWLINPTKAPQGRYGYPVQTDIDFWVLSSNDSPKAPPNLGESLTACGTGCARPVSALDSTLTPSGDYTYKEFPVRGSAFVIVPEQRAAFDKFIKKQAPYNVAPYTDYDFSEVNMYEVAADATVVYQEYHKPSGSGYRLVPRVPVAVRLDYAPPRIAKQTGGPSDTWLSAAGIDTKATNADCLTAPFTPSNAVYCDISQTQVEAGLLNTSTDITYALLDKGGFDCAGVDQMREFLDDGSSMLVMEGVIEDVEECPSKELLGRSGSGLSAIVATVASPFIIRYPANPAAQFGDFDADFAQGTVSGWHVFDEGAAGYGLSQSLVRLLTKDEGTQCTNNISTPTCDVAASGQDQVDLLTYGRYLDDPTKGMIFYGVGNNITQNGNIAQLRAFLNSFLYTPHITVVNQPEDLQISRNSAIVSTLSGTATQYQGTFEFDTNGTTVTVYGGAGDDATFTFPAVIGHFRAVPIDSITLSTEGDGNSVVTDYSDLEALQLFDVNDGGIPTATPASCAAYDGSCRTIFTNIAAGSKPARIPFTTAQAVTLEPLLGLNATLSEPEVETLISRIHAGYPDGSGGYISKLGGVDRSTVAIVESSPVVVGTRPTIAYFGALDGMLHAVCVDDVGVCDIGRELWAYIPRTQLPLLRENVQRIDGSPKVADVLADFDSNGTREFKTVLVFQTGAGDASSANTPPAVIALDITNPQNPQILWDASQVGVGLGLALGHVDVGGSQKHLTFATTNRATGDSAIIVRAYNTATGAMVWENTHTYDIPPRAVAGTPQVPMTGIPAGPTAVDIDGSNEVTHLLYPTLVGEVWMVAAGTGANPFATKPAFRFTQNFRPIGASVAVYRDGASRLHALVGSGGYADPISLTTWSPLSDLDDDPVLQHLVSFKLDLTTGQAPVPETGTNGARDFVVNLSPGQRVFAQPTVAGGEVILLSDAIDTNDLSAFGQSASGQLQRFLLTTGAQEGTTINVAAGVSSADVANGQAFVGGGGGAQRVELADFNAVGSGTEVSTGGYLQKFLWLLTE